MTVAIELSHAMNISKGIIKTMLVVTSLAIDVEPISSAVTFWTGISLVMNRRMLKVVL